MLAKYITAKYNCAQLDVSWCDRFHFDIDREKRWNWAVSI